MSEFADDIVADVKRLVFAEADKLGREITDDLVRSVSVPVQYIGGATIRSLPGEPPRKEFGDLADSIQYELLDYADSFSLTIYTDHQIALWLEAGTARIKPRPHFRPCFERWVEVVPERLFQAVQNG